MNTPTYNALVSLYKKIGSTNPERSFKEDLEYYLRHGYVFSGPEYFVMGSRIADGWHIYVAAGIGATKKFCELMPHYLPWIGWSREAKGKKSTKWYRTDDVIRRLGYDYIEFKNRKIDEAEFRP